VTRLRPRLQRRRRGQHAHEHLPLAVQLNVCARDVALQQAQPNVVAVLAAGHGVHAVRVPPAAGQLVHHHHLLALAQAHLVLRQVGGEVSQGGAELPADGWRRLWRGRSRRGCRRCRRGLRLAAL
jgi:hypothetical protein